ncbi:hypothetical protein Sfulv_60320 [Streptomyces fulvorobeus]|uniref:Uncharacterized protein n=1 Tax=Streptomyces fulvorobeus TaxID=284028 RepID=A0A7J0CFF5_9ACTN|nr:hypothetical protein Sfulv_60320 [Streptomyces fulvorobeus]
MGLDLGRSSLRPPLTAPVLVEADQFLLLGVHADHRVASAHVFLGPVVDVVELGIPVGMLGTFEGLGVGLEAESLLPQKVSDGIRRDTVALPGELVGESAGGLRRPAQRRHRIPAHVGLD